MIYHAFPFSSGNPNIPVTPCHTPEILPPDKTQRYIIFVMKAPSPELSQIILPGLISLVKSEAREEKEDARKEDPEGVPYGDRSLIHTSVIRDGLYQMMKDDHQCGNCLKGLGLSQTPGFSAEFTLFLHAGPEHKDRDERDRIQE